MLKPLSKIIHKPKFMVYDVEALSIKENTTFKMVGLFSENGYKYFTEIKDFLSCVLKDKNAGYYIYGHYAGKYDILFILEEFYKIKNFNEWELNKIIDTGGRIIGLTFTKEKLSKNEKTGKIRRHNMVITFADSYSLFSTSLNKLSQNFGVGKKEDHDHNIDFILNEENIEYNKNDCKLLYDSLDIFYKKYAKGIGCKLTIASCAMAVYRKYFQDTNIYGLEENVENFIRKSYAGGRVEIFKTASKPNEKLKCYDINSLYPSMMLKKMPTGPVIFSTQQNKEKIGFYKCEVNLKSEEYLPLLPIKLKGLKFPTGKFEGIYDNEEIKEAQKNKNYDIKITNGFYFLKSEKIFKNYVKYYYSLKTESKKNNNKTGYMIAKMFLNSLYGKFAQRRDKEVIVFCNNYKLAKEKKLILYNEKLSLWKLTEYSRAKHIIPSLSAHITSLARVHLYKYLQLCKNELFYCDTDSVYTTKKLNTSEKIGDMKLEKYIKNANFYLPKTYSFDEIDEFNNFIKHYDIQKGFDKGLKIGDLKLLGYKSALNNIGNVDNNHIFLKHGIFNKVNKATYNKRIVQNGVDTIALSVTPEDFIKKEKIIYSEMTEKEFELLDKNEQLEIRTKVLGVTNFGIKDVNKKEKFFKDYEHWL